MAKAKTIAIASTILAGLCACSSAPEQADAFHRITGRGTALGQTENLRTKLFVHRPSVEAAVAQRAIAFRTEDGTIRHRRRELWADSPEVLIGERIAERLAAKGIRKSSAGEETEVNLRIRVSEFEETPGGNGTAALSYVLERTSDGKVLAEGRRSATIQARGESAAEIAAAIGTAADAVIDAAIDAIIPSMKPM